MSQDQQRPPPPPRSAASKFAEALLVGVLEAGGRAIARAGESLAGDAKKALQNQAAKAEMVERGIEWWRKAKFGEVDDLPGSLRDDQPTGSQGAGKGTVQ